MAYHITKTQKIQDTINIIYYQGSHSWTTVYEDRKVYRLKREATADLYEFGGEVVKDIIYDPNATDGDGDGIVQEGTEFERSIDT